MTELFEDACNDERSQYYELINAPQLRLLKVFACKILCMTNDNKSIDAHVIQDLAYEHGLLKPTRPGNEYWDWSELFDDIEDEEMEIK